MSPIESIREATIEELNEAHFMHRHRGKVETPRKTKVAEVIENVKNGPGAVATFIPPRLWETDSFCQEVRTAGREDGLEIQTAVELRRINGKIVRVIYFRKLSAED